MAKKNILLQTPPYLVEKSIKTLGNNLQTARLRRGLTIKDVAEKIGTGVKAVSDAEKGKVSTSIAMFTALLWVYDLLQPMENLADPLSDKEGLRLAELKEPKRVRSKKEINNDF